MRNQLLAKNVSLVGIVDKYLNAAFIMAMNQCFLAISAIVHHTDAQNLIRIVVVTWCVKNVKVRILVQNVRL